MLVDAKPFKHKLLLGAISLFSSIAWAETEVFTFEDWKAQFYQTAVSHGISEPQLAQLLTLTPYEKAISHDQSQAEFKKFLWQYLATAVSAERIRTGQEKFMANQELLNRVAKTTGVSPQIITAIWGIETRYGGYTGKVPVMRAMATLAYEGRRKQFFENELLTALKLIDHGDIPSFDVKGSWAGGLGMPQFIPSSYQRYGVDDNGDGVVNLWQTADALASIGHYLSQSGWQADYRWGREVTLVDGFDYLLANGKDKKTLSEWQALGVRDINGMDLPSDNIAARLYVPAGQFGPKFLLYKNFDVIKRYNNSNSYALAVSLLSDRIMGDTGLRTPWPTNAKKVTVNDVKIVQTALNAYGFHAGKVDGIFGGGTRRALQAYQAAKGLVADGFLTTDLYRELITNREPLPPN